jgi:hypothetical protein
LSESPDATGPVARFSVAEKLTCSLVLVDNQEDDDAELELF